MIRKLVVSLLAASVVGASLPAEALAQQKEQPPPAPELVKEIQSRLFDLNYVIWPDGNWDDRTRAAIKGWHQNTNRPISDAMSDDDVAYLRTASPLKVWGGVAYDSKGHYRLFANVASRKDLIDKEVSYCKEKLASKSCGLDVLLQTTIADNNCTGVSHADWKEGETIHSSSWATRRPDIATASDDAVGECSKSAPKDNCKLLAAVCADGSSQKGDLESK
jgi:hypothetical protein